MPTTTKPVEVTADEAMQALGVTTRQAVAYMIHTGKLPGAHRLQPGKRGSPWIIPVASIEAYVEQKAQEKKKRAAAGKA